jgi:hypothetical protein
MSLFTFDQFSQHINNFLKTHSLQIKILKKEKINLWLKYLENTGESEKKVIELINQRHSLKNIIDSFQKLENVFHEGFFTRYNFIISAEKIEHSLVKKYWTEECTIQMNYYSKKEGKQFHWKAFDVFSQILGPEKLDNYYQDYRKMVWINDQIPPKYQFYVHASYNIVMYYVMSSEFQQRIQVRIFPQSKCKICGEEGSNNNYAPSQVPFIDYYDLDLYICSRCSSQALFNNGETIKPKMEMLDDLIQLTEELQFVPMTDYINVVRHKKLNIPKENKVNIIKILTRISSVKQYREHFGSWFEALVEANILPGSTLQGVYGVRCIALDGHVCNSLSEKIIDDWLYRNDISHSKEPVYPYHPELNPNNRRADWKIADYYVEFFGLTGNIEYDKKTIIKMKLAEINDLKLIGLFSDDLYELGEKLGQFK